MIRYQPKYRVGTIRYEGETNVGVRGPAGPGLEFIWDGTRLGVREAGQSAYQYVDLLGPEGKTGPEGKQGKQGERGEAFTYDDFTAEQLAALTGPEGRPGANGAPGADGKDLEFHWDGTRLGVRVKGSGSNYQYMDLQGPAGQDGKQGEQGKQGERGEGFDILGYYGSLTALQAAVPSPDVGDAYGVGTAAPYDIYIWDPVSGSWKNNGPLQGARGEQGEAGKNGKSLEFVWSGTRLGIRQEGGNYQYVDLQGPAGQDGQEGKQGPTGPAGDPGYTPQRGIDYWTSADRQSMVQDVLAALPVYQGEVSSV